MNATEICMIILTSIIGLLSLGIVIKEIIKTKKEDSKWKEKH